MCLIIFSWQQHADHPLILVANRDERYARPTQQLQRWQEIPEIIGGRDLQAGGSWLAVNRQGRFAAVTNVRDPRPVSQDARSRGKLITDCLTSDLSLADWLGRLRHTRQEYAGFNLLVGDIRAAQLFCYNNQSDRLQELPSGLYGLSNSELDDPWPKVSRGKQLLNEAIHPDGPPDVDALLGLLTDNQQPDEAELPDTGIGLELERMLAPITIQTDDYGTCSSTVLLTDHLGQVQIHEQNRRPGAETTLMTEFWKIDG